MLSQGLRYGVEFSGGTQLILHFQATPEVDQIRSAVDQVSPGAVIQSYGDPAQNRVLVRVAQEAPESRTSTRRRARSARRSPRATPRTPCSSPRPRSSGRSWARELQAESHLPHRARPAGAAHLHRGALQGRRLGRRAPRSRASTTSLICLGFLTLFHYEITLNVIAALLTLVGYSVNDTVVVFDRVRENLGKRRKDPLPPILNDSMNQTLTRTLISNGTTLLAVLGLYLFGGEVLRGFSFTMVVGVLVGTYSTVFIAVPFVNWWYSRDAEPRNPCAPPERGRFHFLSRTRAKNRAGMGRAQASGVRAAEVRWPRWARLPKSPWSRHPPSRPSATSSGRSTRTTSSPRPGRVRRRPQDAPASGSARGCRSRSWRTWWRLALIVLVPIFMPEELPEQGDRRVVFFDPPPPPPPPMQKGSSTRPEQVKPDPPKKVVETPKPDFVAPIETHQPQEKPLEPETGVKPEEQFGSETGSDLGRRARNGGRSRGRRRGGRAGRRARRRDRRDRDRAGDGLRHAAAADPADAPDLSAGGLHQEDGRRRAGRDPDRARRDRWSGRV